MPPTPTHQQSGRLVGFPLNTAALNDVLRLSSRSRAEVAQAAEISPSTLSDLCNGRRCASPPTARKIAAAARCDVATLFPAVLAVSARMETAQ